MDTDSVAAVVRHHAGHGAFRHAARQSQVGATGCAQLPDVLWRLALLAAQLNLVRSSDQSQKCILPVLQALVAA